MRLCLVYKNQMVHRFLLGVIVAEEVHHRMAGAPAGADRLRRIISEMNANGTVPGSSAEHPIDLTTAVTLTFSDLPPDEHS